MHPNINVNAAFLTGLVVFSLLYGTSFNTEVGPLSPTCEMSDRCLFCPLPGESLCASLQEGGWPSKLYHSWGNSLAICFDYCLVDTRHLCGTLLKLMISFFAATGSAGTGYTWQPL